jgi:hypothetical protein
MKKQPFLLNTQNIRLLDVFFIGPFLIYAGCQKSLSPAVRTMLIVIGAGTVIYNGARYIQQSKQDEALR